MDLLGVLFQRRLSIEFIKSKKEINSASNYPLSIFQSSIDKFNENKDDVIIQARKTGFPIYKEQNFYETALNEYS